MEERPHNKIIDGRKAAARIKEELRAEVERLRVERALVPGLAVVLVGEDPASKIYVRNKARACEKVGIRSFEHRLAESSTLDELLALVARLNASAEVHGILVQLPLPSHMDAARVIEAVDPAKDVDGFHPYNMGRLFTGSPALEPCTPGGIMRLIESTGVEIAGKDAVIIGRSNIVGKPMALMLLRRSATVTICHSKTRDIEEKVRGAEILVVAMGRLRFVKGEWIRPGAVVIDVGMNRTPEGSLAGDVDFDAALERAAYITPVPGGVGPMTIAMLMSNTVAAARALAGLEGADAAVQG